MPQLSASPWTINLGNISGAASSPSDIILSSDWLNQGSTPNVKRYQIVETTEDLLVLSATWRRLRQDRDFGNHNGYLVPTTLTDQLLFNSITDADRVRADEIADYYSKKVVYWKLKEIPLSKFREEMNTFIHSDRKRFKEEIMPLAYRLPEFYEYDIEFENLAREHNQKLPVTGSISCVKNLKLVKTMQVNKKNLKRKEYWFVDTNDNLVMIPVDTNNPLTSLLDLVSQNTVKIDSNFLPKTSDHTEYFTAKKFKFI